MKQVRKPDNRFKGASEETRQVISFDEFKGVYAQIAGEPEFELYFKGTDTSYMIIKYDDHVSFQRCGYENGSGEFDYSSLDELYSQTTVDGIRLERDWSSIETIIANSSFDLSVKEEVNELLLVFGQRH